MQFYKKFIRTFNDLPNHHTLLIHSLTGCNFKCLGCHNYDEIVSKKHDDYYTEQDIIEHLELNGFIFDAVIISGGEFLLEKIENISNFLLKIRKVFDGKIIINTNGSFPNKIEYLLENKLVEGFHIDMKLPYHMLDVENDKDIFIDTIGFSPSQHFIDKLLQSINITVSHNSPYSQIRTVEYPHLSNEFFEFIESYVNDLNKKHNSNMQYHLNEFLDVNNEI